MSAKTQQLLILLVAIVACSFVGSIKGEVGSNEAERTGYGVAVGSIIVAYKLWNDRGGNV